MTPPADENPRTGIARASLALGIVAIVVALLPFVNNFAWLVGLVGIIVSIISLMNSANKRMPTVGLVLSLFSGGIGLFMAAVWATLFIQLGWPNY